MPEFKFDPSIPRRRNEQPFVQQIQLVDAKREIARAIWHTSGVDGVVQLVELTVVKSAQRRGHASKLLDALIAQARAFFKSCGNTPLRRIWVPVEQKSQVLGRAFLTGRGFHHVATISDVLKEQDILIYLRSFD